MGNERNIKKSFLGTNVDSAVYKVHLYNLTQKPYSKFYFCQACNVFYLRTSKLLLTVIVKPADSGSVISASVTSRCF